VIDGGFNPGGNIIGGGNNIGSGNNIDNSINNNYWLNNHQNVINNSPTIIGGGFRPGVAVPGWGVGLGTNWGYGGGGFVDNSWQYGAGYRPAYWGYHDDWYHGFADNDNGWDWGSYAAGVGTNWLSSWSLGSRVYDWGYSSYSNPYYVEQPATTTTTIAIAPYDYAQPIDTELAPPAPARAEEAVSDFDLARDAFQSGDYESALKQVDLAIRKMPNDAAIHEFRSLVLFALGRFDESAATLYPVLSVGPGWDWTTMIGLFSGIEAYTTHLRALEAFAKANPTNASAPFLLAYHYLTGGNREASASQLRRVVEMKPDDKLSAYLLELLTGPTKAADAAPVEAPEPVEIDPKTLVGTWSAQPGTDTTIRLELQDDGLFTWDVKGGGGEPRRIAGTYTIEADVLNLAQTGGGAMVGRVAPEGDRAFRFRVVGSGGDDPGLAFTR